jgi:hypothetical protein
MAAAMTYTKIQQFLQQVNRILGLSSFYKIPEIFQYLQTRLLALFGVELCGNNIVLPDH